MARLTDLVATIDAAAESLSAVLDPARCEQLAPVSPVQLRVLLLLRSTPTMNVNGLARALHVGASSASRLCDRLEALGLINRDPDPRDRREIQLSLTIAATELLAELSRYRRHALESVLAEMSESTRQELARSLAAFSRAADALVGPVSPEAPIAIRRSA